MRIVCSTTHLFHYLFTENAEILESILKDGLRPLSDFPDSARWQQIQAQRPDFFETLYNNFAMSVINKPYENSGIFLTPIDFYQLPQTLLYKKIRVAIPLERISAADSALTYDYQSERISVALDKKGIEAVAELWQEDLVLEWFGKDENRVFFHVPQVVTYQRIPVNELDLQKPPKDLAI